MHKIFLFLCAVFMAAPTAARAEECNVEHCTECRRGTSNICEECEIGWWRSKWKGGAMCCPPFADCSDGNIKCYSRYGLKDGMCVACPAGQWSAGGTVACSPCSSIPVANGQCAACSSTGDCTSVSCNSGYASNGTACVKAVSCRYPLKEAADYSGECAGCCTD